MKGFGRGGSKKVREASLKQELLEESEKTGGTLRSEGWGEEEEGGVAGEPRPPLPSHASVTVFVPTESRLVQSCSVNSIVQQCSTVL